MTSTVSRRSALITAIGAGGLIMTSAQAVAQSGSSPAVKSYQPEMLPFDPKSLAWLSEKILTSHHDNNYVGAVKRLNMIGADFAKLDMKATQGFVLNGLKREELLAFNSMILHEIYFKSLGKSASRPGAKLLQQIETDFGSFERWTQEFAAMGKALGGGSGWVLLSWSPRAGRLVNQWAADHTMTVADGTPLLALDMYEHAYHMDYGAKASAYVDAYMSNIEWSSAERMFSKYSG
ncbi:superoxide dismutase [Asticcacaulis sp. SL142]|uniref:superoxide dismutase n=1 Tax=Asticcacaulis sp. SL142 TaxID=2995155 RepID=UPI00226CC231|nr:Fe-Mn family superoxide dismutase [Asticcacaulis sp. SL142]WAC49866.1 superoxide dismutase [Asticcacaulis sp. SL142]